MDYNQQLADFYGNSLRIKAKDDPIFFFNRCLKTFDPRKEARDLDFVLYPYQVEFILKAVDKITRGEDWFVEKSRDMGVSWMMMGIILWFWLFKDGFQCLIGSRTETYVDNRLMDSLFGKLDYLIDHLPFKIDGYTKEKDRTFLKMVNRKRQSAIAGESANVNFSRAGRYNLVFFDELAFWPFAQGSWEASGDASPCRVAVTTPSPEPSFAKALRNSGLVEVETLHWHLHPEKDDEWYEKEKRRRSQDELSRELDINWEGSITGIVYPEIDYAKIADFALLPFSPLYVSWDFGLDGTAIQWWQKNLVNGKFRLIESYSNSDKVIEYYFPFFGAQVSSAHQYRKDDLTLIDSVKDWPKPTHFGDPDVAKRDLKEGTSTRVALQAAGIYVQTNTKANDFESRKTELKRILAQGVEVNDTPQNRFWVECLKNARYPQRRDTSQAVTPILKPIHDWTSHHRSSSEYFAVNYQGEPRKKRPFLGYEGGDEVTGFGRRPVRSKGNIDNLD